jgi:hypothetical protein
MCLLQTKTRSAIGNWIRACGRLGYIKERQLRSGFGAGSVLVEGAGVLELSLFAAGAGVLVSDEGAGVCAGWLGWVLMSFVCDCDCGVVVSLELCA